VGQTSGVLSIDFNLEFNSFISKSISILFLFLLDKISSILSIPASDLLFVCA
jgi:hypothetical protein